MVASPLPGAGGQCARTGRAGHDQRTAHARRARRRASRVALSRGRDRTDRERPDLRVREPEPRCGPHRRCVLHRAGVAPRILVTGGAVRPGEPSEAEVYASVLMRAGVAADRVIVEPHATNTGENVALGMAAIASARARSAPRDARRLPDVAAPVPGDVRAPVPRRRRRDGARLPDPRPLRGTTAKARRTVCAGARSSGDVSGLGFFAPQPIPSEVAAAAERLRELDAAVVYARARS